MKEKICGEAVKYMHQCKASHQFIVPISGVGKAAGAAVKSAANRTTTLHCTHGRAGAVSVAYTEYRNVHQE